ncbi:MAG: hypothetical protein ACOZB3_02365, partial [Calditrichota bacterium]
MNDSYKYRVPIIAVLFVLCTAIGLFWLAETAEGGYGRGGYGRTTASVAAVGDYDYPIEYTPPAGSQTWRVSTVPGAPTDAGLNYLNITDGPGVCTMLSFLMYVDGAASRGQADSTLALTRLSIYIDGVPAIYRVPLQDCFGTAEVCSVQAVAKWFGKTVGIRDSNSTVSFDAATNWYLNLPISWQDSFRVFVENRTTGLSGKDIAGCWFKALGYMTPEYESRYNLRGYYTADTLGRWDYHEVLSLT